jgi:hypothetical protein
LEAETMSTVFADLPHRKQTPRIELEGIRNELSPLLITTHASVADMPHEERALSAMPGGMTMVF